MSRILIVEGKESLCLNTQALLEGAGYVVSTAGDGREAKARLSEAVFDVVLLDIPPAAKRWHRCAAPHAAALSEHADYSVGRRTVARNRFGGRARSDTSRVPCGQSDEAARP